MFFLARSQHCDVSDVAGGRVREVAGGQVRGCARPGQLQLCLALPPGAPAAQDSSGEAEGSTALAANRIGP